MTERDMRERLLIVRLELLGKSIDHLAHAIEEDTKVRRRITRTLESDSRDDPFLQAGRESRRKHAVPVLAALPVGDR